MLLGKDILMQDKARLLQVRICDRTQWICGTDLLNLKHKVKRAAPQNGGSSILAVEPDATHTGTGCIHRS
jgi:hypothetical protein